MSSPATTDTPGGLAVAAAKAALLVEALPYIRRFSGKTVVVKYGGSALEAAGHEASGDTEEASTSAAGTRKTPRSSPSGSSPSGAFPSGSSPSGSSPSGALASFAEDVVLLHSVGIRVVVVHGGGPQIGALMERLGMVPVFRDGHRVTDAETLDIARMVLVGKVNREIVSAMNVHGALAVGLSGEDANLIRASARSVDLGFVGDVEVVDPVLIERLLAQGLIPVVATIGSDAAGQAYNINADTVAGAVAEALLAEKLVFLTDVEGLRADPKDPGSLVRVLDAARLDEMVESGVAGAGMSPKARACSKALRSGVRQAHILDGRVPHSLLLEIFTDEGVGTMVTP